MNFGILSRKQENSKEFYLKTIVYPSQNQITVEEMDAPVHGEEDILVRSLYSMVSAGTELRMLSGNDFPMVPGYSVIGEVMDVGAKVSGYKVGDLVSGRSCKRFIPGTDFCCGGHMATQVLPTLGEDRAVVLPSGASPLDYVISEISSISLRGVEGAAVQAEETAVVIGLGLIGAFSAAWLHARGCYVVATDLEEARLNRAVGCWAHEVVNGRDADAGDRILAYLNGGADIVVEGSGSPQGAMLAYSLVRGTPRGNAYVEGSTYRGETIGSVANNWPRVVMQASYTQEISIHPHGFYPGEGVTILTPADRSLEDRQKAVRAISQGQIKAEDFIDRIASVDEAPDAYAALRDDKNSNYSLIFDWSK
ncbi:MAG: zinc-binding dehydrogenase [Candidatus Omnitrophota bacterium]